MAESNARPGATYWRAIEPIWTAISIYDGPETFLQQFQRVDRSIGLLFAVHWCQSEVCNGGFHQFFQNPSGVLAPEAREGFNAIGLPRCATLLDQAMAFFGPIFPRDRSVRMTMLDAYAEKDPTADQYRLEGWNPFRELDRRFYEALDNKNTVLARQADEFARRLGR